MGIKRGHEFLHREGGSSVVACGGRGSRAQRMRDERREFGGRAWGGRNNKWGTPRLTSRKGIL